MYMYMYGSYLKHQHLNNVSAGLSWLRRKTIVDLKLTSSVRHSSNSIICNDTRSVRRAYKILQFKRYVFVDTEGHTRNSSNRSDDSLSIIQIGTPGATRVFLFDMRKLLAEERYSVLSLLADPQIIKVGWGLPVDYEILRNGYNTHLSSVLDLQIVDILSRATRGEGEKERVARLGWRNVSGELLLEKGLELDGIHALNRMDTALQEHDIRGVPMKETFPSNSWHIRPLKASLSRYATNDIIRISALYEHFKACKYLRPGSWHLSQLMLQSAIYISSLSRSTVIGLSSGKVRKRSNLLPLGILRASLRSKSQNIPFFVKNQDSCKRCRSTLEGNNFELLSGVRTPAGSVCRVCALLKFRQNYIAGIIE